MYGVFIAIFNCPWISCKANIAVSSSVLTSDHVAYILQYISCTALFSNVQREHLFDKPPGTGIIALQMLAEPHFLMPGVTCSVYRNKSKKKKKKNYKWIEKIRTPLEILICSITWLNRNISECLRSIWNHLNGSYYVEMTV